MSREGTRPTAIPTLQLQNLANGDESDDENKEQLLSEHHPALPPQLEHQTAGLDPEEKGRVLEEHLAAQQGQVNQLRSWLAATIVLRAARGFLARRRVAQLKAAHAANFDNRNDDLDLDAEAAHNEEQERMANARNRLRAAALAVTGSFVATLTDRKPPKTPPKRQLGDFSPLDLPHVTGMKIAEVKKELKRRGIKVARGKNEVVIAQLERVRAKERSDMLYDALRLGLHPRVTQVLAFGDIDLESTAFFDPAPAAGSGDEEHDVGVGGVGGGGNAQALPHHEPALVEGRGLPMQIEPASTQTDGELLTPLMLAARYCNENVVQDLVARKCSPNRVIEEEDGASSQSSGSGRSALHFAAEGHRARSLAVLVSAKAALDCQDRSGVTALEMVVVADAVHCASVLLEAKADPNVPMRAEFRSLPSPSRRRRHHHRRRPNPKRWQESEGDRDRDRDQWWSKVRSGAAVELHRHTTAEQQVVEEVWVENQQRFVAAQLAKVLDQPQNQAVLSFEAQVEWVSTSYMMYACLACVCVCSSLLLVSVRNPNKECQSG